MIEPTTLTLADGLLIIEPIAPLNQLEEQATAAELQAVEGITSTSRRAERLAWRKALRERVGAECQIGYTQQGAPHISGSRFGYISVSHCADCVALLLGDSPCGVDVERTERNFGRVARRYISAKESRLSTDERGAAAIWCAKEALYKMQGRAGVDFLRDMEILSLDFDSLSITARLLDGPIVEMGILLPDAEHLLVYTK